jgi:hypothetical protein
MASADYAGELTFWDLTTGQALTTPSLLGTVNGLLGHLHTEHGIV